MGCELLSEGNLCGATLLSVVASGSALIAELLRLGQAIPAVFLDPEERSRRGAGVVSAEEAAFERVLFDFAYLREPEEFENRVNSSDGWLDVDTDFLEAHGAFAARFYALCEGVVSYWRDVDAFLVKLDAGYFIAHSVDGVLEDGDGKQLLCEAFFLYGTMLLLLDAKIPGVVRERLVVAAYRHQGEAAMDALDDVCRLARASGWRAGGRRPRNYPESLFRRFETPATARVAPLVIQRLMSDDVYLATPSFPAPEHRSARLAAQASMLYVTLYFAPETLKRHKSAMREAVDRHFADNWVVPVYMGHVVDLSVEWAPYPAARAALANVLSLAGASVETNHWFKPD